VKDYRIKGRDRYKRMTLGTFEFIRRFLVHVLPSGFHRIRHYGLFAKNAWPTTSHAPVSYSPHQNLRARLPLSMPTSRVVRAVAVA